MLGRALEYPELSLVSVKAHYINDFGDAARSAATQEEQHMMSRFIFHFL